MVGEGMEMLGFAIAAGHESRLRSGRDGQASTIHR
jgi:hypothetical protein